MGSLFSKGLKSLVFVVVLCATHIHAMEQQKNDQVPCEDIQEQTDTVVERIYKVFSKQLEERFTKKPNNFYEAIVLIKHINTLLERSEITAQTIGDDFKITHDNCEIASVHVDHCLLHPIFKKWFSKVCKKILLEHPLSLEALNLILNRISENVSLKNMEKYHKAIESLPTIAAEYIKNEFIDMHGWPLNIKNQIIFDEKKIIKSLRFATKGINTHLFNEKDIVIVKGFEDGFIELQGDIRDVFGNITAKRTFRTCINGELLKGLCLELGLKEEEFGVFSSIWQKPTFKQALEKRAFENKKKKANKRRCIIS